MSIQAGSPLLGLDDLPQRHVGPWSLTRPLGKGGMAVVYHAVHKETGEEAAIKLLLADTDSDPLAAKRFIREATSLDELEHPHIVDLLDYAEESPLGPYMALSYLKGMDLHALIRESAPFPLSWVSMLFEQLCDALSYSHSRDVVHRDLKPSNIFLVESDFPGVPDVRLLDFGVAKVKVVPGRTRLTKTGAVLGTPAYLAPEQIQACHKVTGAADVYALGVVLFECLTGRLPFVCDSYFSYIVSAVRDTPPLLGEVREEFAGSPLEDLVAHTLEKDPAHRQQSVDEFWEEFEMASQLADDPLDLEENYPTVYAYVNDTVEFETPDLVSYATDGSAVFALDDGSALSEDMPSNRAFLDTLDASFAEDFSSPSDEYASASFSHTEIHTSDSRPSFDALPVGGSHERWAGVYASSQKQARPSSGSGRWLFLLGFGSFLCLLLLGGAWWYTRPVPESVYATFRAVKSRGTTLPSKTLTIRERLLSAKRAREKGDWKACVVQWRAVMADPTWKEHTSFPDLYRRAAALYLKHNYNHSSLAFLMLFRRHLTGNARRQYDKHIEALRSRIKQAKPNADVLWDAYRLDFSKKKWKIALSIYRQLRALDPSDIHLHMRLLETVLDQFPAFALVEHENFLVHVVPTPKQSRQLAALRLRLSLRDKRIRRLAKAFFVDLSGQLSSITRHALEKKLTLWFDQHVYWHHPGVQVIAWKWMKTILLHHPKHVAVCWKLFTKRQLALVKDGRALWLAQAEPDWLSPVRLHAGKETLSVLLRVSQLVAGYYELLKRGESAKSVKWYQQGQALCQDLKNATPFLFVDSSFLAKKIASCKRLGLLSRFQRQIRRAASQARWKMLDSWHRELLRNVPEPSLRRAMASNMKRYHLLRVREQREYRRAEALYNARKWNQARLAYKRYMRRFRYSWRRKEARRKHKASRCASGLFAFEICPKNAYPKHYRK